MRRLGPVLILGLAALSCAPAAPRPAPVERVARWRVGWGGVSYPTAAATADRLIVYRGQGRDLAVLDRATGEVRWKHDPWDKGCESNAYSIGEGLIVLGTDGSVEGPTLAWEHLATGDMCEI